MGADLYVETTSSMGRKVGILPATLLNYVRLGLVQARRLPNGQHLFRASDEKLIREINAKRLANRGGNHAPKAAQTA
jgi:DNA-binding transcriptional MerR regulator